jgi:hypothetical protein
MPRMSSYGRAGWAETAWICLHQSQPLRISQTSMTSSTHVLFCRLTDFNSNTMPGSSSKEISQIQHKLAASCALASLLQAQQVFACPTSWRGQVAWPQSIYFRPKNTLWWLEEQGEPWKNQREGLLPKKRELKKTPDWQNDYTYKLFDVAKLLLGPFLEKLNVKTPGRRCEQKMQSSRSNRFGHGG